MKERRREPVSPQMLAAFVDNEVTPFEAERIEAALADSAATRRSLTQLRRVRDALSSPIPELESVDLVANVRRQIAAGLPAHSKSRAWAVVASACLAAAAALVRVYRTDEGMSAERTGQHAREAEFRVKSSLAARDERARWTGIHAYSVLPGLEPQPLSGRLPRNAGLLFSYTNLSAAPFAYLMIFMTDARGEVHWCHPAYQELGTNPVSLRIEEGQGSVLLSEVIRLKPSLGPAILHALFSTEPQHVLDVEHWLRAPRMASAPPPWPSTFHQVIPLEVAP